MMQIVSLRHSNEICDIDTRIEQLTKGGSSYKTKRMIAKKVIDHSILLWCLYVYFIGKIESNAINSLNDIVNIQQMNEYRIIYASEYRTINHLNKFKDWRFLSFCKISVRPVWWKSKFQDFVPSAPTNCEISIQRCDAIEEMNHPFDEDKADQNSVFKFWWMSLNKYNWCLLCQCY